MKPLTVNGLEEICKEITNKDSPVLLSFFKDDQEIWTNVHSFDIGHTTAKSGDSMLLIQGKYMSTSPKQSNLLILTKESDNISDINKVSRLFLLNKGWGEEINDGYTIMFTKYFNGKEKNPDGTFNWYSLNWWKPNIFYLSKVYPGDRSEELYRGVLIEEQDYFNNIEKLIK